MAEAAKDQDQSMEDILQSIKRIIAEEGDPVAPAPAEDVLDLTEMVADDGAVKPVDAPEKTDMSAMSLDEIMAAPMASMMAEPEVPAPEPELTPEPVPEPTPEPVMASPIPAVAPAPVAAAPATDEGLMSEATRVASIAALSALNDAVAPSAPVTMPDSISFRSGTTVEDLVAESLRPMLRDWIDSHLPGIVERLVEREIRKLTRG
jgi:cell pole-organizing protein PopZ